MMIGLKVFFGGQIGHNLDDILHVGPTEVHGTAVDIVKNQLHVVTLERGGTCFQSDFLDGTLIRGRKMVMTSSPRRSKSMRRERRKGETEPKTSRCAHRFVSCSTQLISFLQKGFKFHFRKSHLAVFLPFKSVFPKFPSNLFYLADNFNVTKLPSDERLGEVVEHRGEVCLVFDHFREVFHSQRSHFPRRSQLLRSESCRGLRLAFKCLGLDRVQCSAPPSFRFNMTSI